MASGKVDFVSLAEEKPSNGDLSTCTKLKTLPRVSEELFRCKLWFDRIKKNHWKIGKSLNIAEWILLQCALLIKSGLCSKHGASFVSRRSGKVKIVDQFLCHQLEFIEQHLRQVDTAYLYQPGGLVERSYLLVCLLLRLLFIFPRLTYGFLTAAIDVTGTEILENVNLTLKIAKRAEIRRSQRINKRKVSRSPGKKRKHEETESSKPLPEYFYVHEYSQESDPDFVPDSNGDDTELTSASENSHDDASEDEETAEELNQNDEQINLPEATIIAKNDDVAAVLQNSTNSTPA